MRRILVLDPEGTYCCHPSPKELREWTVEYRIREEGSIIAPTSDEDRERRHQQLLHASPAIFPSLTPDDSDEDRETLDTDDASILEAARRYQSLQRRAAAAKKTLSGERLYLRLDALRAEWTEMKYELDVTWDDVNSLAAPKGREGQLRINRDAYEVRYCHRDPSDWQILTSTPDHVLDLLAHKRKIAEMLDLDYTSEDAEQDRREVMCRYRRTQIAQLWKRHFSELGPDAMQGRIVTRWRRIDGRWIAGASITHRQFVDRKIQDAGDELEGLNTALASMRFRIERQRERKQAKAA